MNRKQDLAEACRWVARLRGRPLLPWQDDYTAELTETYPDPSAEGGWRMRYPKALLLCPRRNGKTEVVLNRCLAGAAILGERVLWTVHSGDTLRDTWREVLKACDPAEDGPLARYVAVGPRNRKPMIVRSQGSESITFRSGGVISMRVRTASGGRGRECDTQVWDEALEATHDQMAALTALRAKAEARGNGQTIFLSSAGHGSSVVLAELRDRAASGLDDRFHFAEYAAARDADLNDHDVWAAANPSLGVSVDGSPPILGTGYLADQRSLLDDEAFGREHCGWFTELVGEPWMPSEAWANALTLTPPAIGTTRPVLGFETQTSGTAALVAAWPLPEGRVWVEPLQIWESPAQLDPQALANDIEAQARRVAALAVAGDKLTCLPVLDRLKRKVRDVRVMGPQEMREASMRTLELAIGGRLAHAYPDDKSILVIQATGVTGADGGRRILRAKSQTDTCLPLATAAAAWLAVQPAPARPITAGLAAV